MESVEKAETAAPAETAEEEIETTETAAVDAANDDSADAPAAPVVDVAAPEETADLTAAAAEEASALAKAQSLLLSSVPSLTPSVRTEKAPITSNTSSDAKDVEDGYVNLDEGIGDDDAAEPFDGVKGAVQPPRYKDGKYAWAFLGHFAFAAYWFVDSYFAVSKSNFCRASYSGTRRLATNIRHNGVSNELNCHHEQWHFFRF